MCLLSLKMYTWQITLGYTVIIASNSNNASFAI